MRERILVLIFYRFFFFLLFFLSVLFVLVVFHTLNWFLFNCFFYFLFLFIFYEKNKNRFSRLIPIFIMNHLVIEVSILCVDNNWSLCIFMAKFPFVSFFSSTCLECSCKLCFSLYHVSFFFFPKISISDTDFFYV